MKVTTVKIGLAIILLVCLLNMPYGYYLLVRLISCIGFGYLAFMAHESKKEKEMIAFVILALLFQPFYKISLGRTLWNIVDTTVAIALFLSVIKVKK
jgi:hypothetical protein